MTRIPKKIPGEWNKRKRPPTSGQVATLLLKCLEEGSRVEIDGLGVFHRSENGAFQFTPFLRTKVFLAYVDEDYASARKMYDFLREQGCDPWLNREKLLPGQNWTRSIRSAIEVSHYFVALFSRRSVNKRGTFQSELRYALDCAARLPLDQTFLIPVRLDECRLPAAISSAIQYVNLFPEWEEGLGRLLRSIRQKR